MKKYYIERIQDLVNLGTHSFQEKNNIDLNQSSAREQIVQNPIGVSPYIQTFVQRGGATNDR